MIAAVAPLAALLGLSLARPALASTVAEDPPRPRVLRVEARPGAAQAALDAAMPGDTVLLAPGRHRGPLVVRRALVLRGIEAVLEGGGQGTVLEVLAPGAAIADLEIRGSGGRVLTVDSGVRVTRAGGVVLRRLVIRDVLYGIYAERAPGLLVERCRLEGRVRPLDETGEGNGVHLWFSDDAAIVGSSVTRFADAIYLSFAHRTRVQGNRSFENGRYGLHTMYCHESRLIENVFTRNVAGIAIMFSEGLVVEGNAIVRNRGPRTYGLLLRDCSGGSFAGNQLVDNTVGIFMDNSNRNRLHGNLFQDNGWAVLLFSSCANNEIAGNDFVHNDYPVALDMRRTSNRFDDGARGNYWSEAAAYDLDADGISDVPYSPVSAFAFVSKQYPDLSILAKSPAVAALEVAERVFPSFQPSEAVDRFPLVRPVRAESRVPRETPAARDRDWGGFGLFAALFALGALGLWRARSA